MRRAEPQPLVKETLSGDTSKAWLCLLPVACTDSAQGVQQFTWSQEGKQHIHCHCSSGIIKRKMRWTFTTTGETAIVPSLASFPQPSSIQTQANASVVLKPDGVHGRSSGPGIGKLNLQSATKELQSLENIISLPKFISL